MQETPKLGLKKPEMTDYVNVNDLNENMDVLDEVVGGLREEVDEHKADDAKRIKIKQGIVISASGWILNSSTQLYEYRINDADVFSETIVDVNIRVADLDKASDLLSANESFNGYVKLYAESQPEEDIKCDLKLIRQVF